MILLRHNNKEIEPFEISEGIVRQHINTLNHIFNDPVDTCQKAIESLKYLWNGLADIEDLRIDLDAWYKLDQIYKKIINLPTDKLSPCNQRTVKTVERTCCGGKTDSITVYYCNIKNQPTTGLGCSKCSIRN